MGPAQNWTCPGTSSFAFSPPSPPVPGSSSITGASHTCQGDLLGPLHAAVPSSWAPGCTQASAPLLRESDLHPFQPQKRWEKEREVRLPENAPHEGQGR